MQDDAARRPDAGGMARGPGSDTPDHGAAFADLVIAAWCWPWLAAPAVMGAAQALFGQTAHPPHHPQLPVPDTIAAHDDHGLFA